MSRLTDILRPGMRVFSSAFTGESPLWADELRSRPDAADGVHFMSVQYPGIDSLDYLALHPRASSSAFFMTPSVRAGFQAGRSEPLSLDYPGIARHLRDMAPPDVAVGHFSTPDADGYCSAGLSADFLPLVWKRAGKRIAHLNPRMPRTRGTFRVHVSELDLGVQADLPLLKFEESGGGETEARIGAHVATLVRDGDTLQFGVGSVPSALAASLVDHRRLKIHSGMVSPSTRALWESGALDRDARITTGVALGTPDFHAFVGEHPTLWFTDVTHTHDASAIVKIPRFMAINSAVEVDLLGQVNSERVSGAIQAGPGGSHAYVQGALGSPGGQSLVCLASTARRGSVSRIVPSLGDKALCTLPRFLADVVITEHGIASLRGLGLEARAMALIAIAAPEHRDALAAQWNDMRRTL